MTVSDIQTMTALFYMRREDWCLCSFVRLFVALVCIAILALWRSSELRGGACVTDARLIG